MLNLESDTHENELIANGLPSIFKTDVLAQLTDLDKTLKQMKDHYITRNFEKFKNIFPGAGQFYNIRLLKSV